MLYFFYGPDSYSAFAEIRRLQDQFVKSQGGAEVQVLDFSGDETDLQMRRRLETSFGSQGLFSTNKFVILRNFLASLSTHPKTEEYLLSVFRAPISQTAVVILEGAKFDKRSRASKAIQKMATESREFLIPDTAGLKTWVRSYLAEKGSAIEPSAVDQFVANLGDEEYSLWQCEQELSKLMLLHPGNDTITLKDVQSVVAPSIPQNIFALTNLVAEGQTAEAIRVLEKMIVGESTADAKQQMIQIVGALASQVRSLLLVKEFEHTSAAEAAKALGWKEGRVWVNLKLAKKFSQERLIRLIRDLRLLDLRLKSTEEPSKLLVTLFLQKARVYP